MCEITKENLVEHLCQKILTGHHRSLKFILYYFWLNLPDYDRTGIDWTGIGLWKKNLNVHDVKKYLGRSQILTFILHYFFQNLFHYDKMILVFVSRKINFQFPENFT